VHGGDALTGTLFYSIFGPRADAAYMNEVRFDAMVAGNHEFDDGDKGLAKFAKLLKAPIVSYNCKLLA
jgi:5'-nucleotidase / UDP-sugar diphosphatase